MNKSTDVTLGYIFEQIQEQQRQRGVNYDELTITDRRNLASQFAHALLVEAAELSSSWAFAAWKTTPTDHANIKREVVDCIFFLTGICNCFNVSPTELVETFEWVLQNNYRRMATGEHKSMAKDYEL